MGLRTGLRIDIRTVLIVCEVRGSSTALGIRMIVFAAKCALTPSDCWSSITCFTGGFDWIGLIFLFERYNLGVPEMSFGIPSNSVFVAYWTGVALYHTSTSILTHGEYVTMLTDPRSFYGYARYTDLYLAHPLETWTPFDIVVNSAYALLTMPVTYKPTNVVISPFIRYSGTSAYSVALYHTSAYILSYG